MSLNMKLWRIEGGDLLEVTKSLLPDEKRLEEWIVKYPELLGMELLLIGRQVVTPNHGRIDLLAIDADANLIVLELKRDKTPRDIVAQALDYASWVKTLTYDEINSVTQDCRKKSLKTIFAEHFGDSLPDKINLDHQIVILASELDDSSRRIVEYLSEEYQVPINVLFFTYFKNSGGEFLGRAWLLDPEEVQDRAMSRKEAPWSGYYFVNVGESEHRNWDDCLKYGFLAAGQDPKYSNPLRRLKEGDLVFAYMKGLGYVGYGKVTKPTTMVKDFVVESLGKHLSKLKSDLKQPDIFDNSDNPEKSEWLVGIEWLKTFPREEAKKFVGAFANQNIVCKLRHPETVAFLKREFGLD